MKQDPRWNTEQLPGGNIRWTTPVGAAARHRTHPVPHLSLSFFKPGRGGLPMGILSDDMKRVVSEQKLGFCETVCPDGSPNLSPKGSTGVWMTITCSSPTSARRRQPRTCGPGRS